MLRSSIILLLCLVIEIASAGNYLFYLPLCSKSVKLAFMPMGLELARRGHKVIIVSPFKEKKPITNIEEINHDSTFEKLTSEISERLLKHNTGSVGDMPFSDVIASTLYANKKALETPELQKILFSDDIKIDVVMTIPIFGNEIGNWVAHKKNASIVHFLSVPFLLPWVASATGNPMNPSYIPQPLFPYSQYMSFKERLMNTVAYLGISVARPFFILPQVESVITEVFPEEKVDLVQLSSDAALSINMGSPFTGDGLRPVMPNVIQSGLMSCKPGQELEGELKDWVEGAEHGAIFLSFGSVVKASKMPEARRKLMLSALSKLKQRIVWKWEKDMPDAPANVKTFPWLPQTDLLAHPNVKLFITHGGAGSIQETICYKTPIVGIPILGDQMNNLQEALTHHMGQVLPWPQVTEDKFLEAVNSVLEDRSYLDSVTSLQNLILDTPQHPLDRAVWWLEYLLRHPHNHRMRSPAKDLYWFQYFLLDVYGSLLVALYIVYKILRTVLCFLCGLCCKSKTKQKTQ